MFSIKVESAETIEGDVWIFGQKEGYPSTTQALHNVKNNNEKYQITNIPFVRYKDHNKIRTHIALILEPGGYNPEDLVGKTLIQEK